MAREAPGFCRGEDSAPPVRAEGLSCEGWDVNDDTFAFQGTLSPQAVFGYLGGSNPSEALPGESFSTPLKGSATPRQQALATRPTPDRPGLALPRGRMTYFPPRQPGLGAASAATPAHLGGQ